MRDAAALLEPHIPALRRYAFALTRDHNAADDLVQDTLERALRRWSGRGDTMRPWLFAVLHNLFVDGVRARRRRPLHGSLDEHEAGAAVAPGQDGAMISRDVLAQFGALSDEHQAVLLLVAVEGLSYVDVSTVLGIPVGTVMSRLSRAREAFRRLLDGERVGLRRVK
ncbi:MAG: sigma-70 family RNA polymerase sigma factor [Methylobacterium sp.]|nr:MAG: sigma-70 family RNA polymerase sigma factor [Methylobacterium sp.]